MRNFSTSPKDLFLNLWEKRALIAGSAKRDVLGRYRGSALGILWSFFNPLFMLTVYTFVFSVIFKARWSVDVDSKSEFALVLFSGLIVFNLFSECINQAPGLILSNVNYVKKVVYPLEVLPLVTLISALFHGLISLAVWLLAYLVFFGVPHATALYFPLIILPYILLILGLSWGLAALGVYLRDISQFVGIFTTVLMFMSPIFYPVTAVPASYRDFLYFNPLTLVIEQTRDVLIWGREPELLFLLGYGLISLFVAWGGFSFFQKTRKGFSDVL